MCFFGGGPPCLKKKKKKKNDISTLWEMLDEQNDFMLEMSQQLADMEHRAAQTGTDKRQSSQSGR